MIFLFVTPNKLSLSQCQDLMPGGVNSPVRAFKSVGVQPIVIDSVKGSRTWDIDGNEYIDYVGSWGTAIVLHAHDMVIYIHFILKYHGYFFLWFVNTVLPCSAKISHPLLSCWCLILLLKLLSRMSTCSLAREILY